ncbi:MAG: hypothetical protein RQ985_07835 [Dehalococcoidia bacterium]|nr:hypothetical protein [Dehalococcoidia bacterium]
MAPQSGKAHAHLRHLVESRLRRPVNETLWRLLVELGDFAHYVGYTEAELVEDGLLDELIELYRRYERIYRAGAAAGSRGTASPQGMEAEGHPGGDLAEGEASGTTRRAAAFASFLAALARTEPSVVRYRREVLGGRTLSEGEALRFIESPVLATAPWELLKDLSCALWEAEGQVWEEDGELVVELTGPVCRRWRGHIEWRWLRYPRQGREEAVRVASQSVLGWLGELASRLARRYHWQEAQASWFILVDTPPWVSPVRWRLNNHLTPFFARPTIELIVEPWWPARRLMEDYRRLQRQLGITKGIGEKASGLVAFLADHVRVRHAPESGANPVLELPPWQRLMALWNEIHPTWRYQDIRHFARDCQAALERVVFKRQLVARWLRLWGQ